MLLLVSKITPPHPIHFLMGTLCAFAMLLFCCSDFDAQSTPETVYTGEVDFRQIAPRKQDFLKTDLIMSEQDFKNTLFEYSPHNTYYEMYLVLRANSVYVYCDNLDASCYQDPRHTTFKISVSR